MEIKIGIQQLSRELTVESPLTPAEVETMVTEALEGTAKVLVLEDEKSRKVLVPTAQLAYVEIGELSVRRVGFGAM